MWPWYAGRLLSFTTPHGIERLLFARLLGLRVRQRLGTWQQPAPEEEEVRSR